MKNFQYFLEKFHSIWKDFIYWWSKFNISLIADGAGGMTQYSTAVPSSSFVPGYPVQQPAQYAPDVVITKPIQPLPGITYGSIVQPAVVPTEIIVINGKDVLESTPKINLRSTVYS